MIRNFLKYISNIPSWRTNRKLIVFLSDDWGGMRIPSLKERAALIHAGIKMNGNRFNQFDCLENNQDLEGLFEVLSKHKNHFGKHPVITAVSNVASPDYNRIKAAGFDQYFYKNTLECLSERKNSDRVHDLYLEGIKNNIYYPEFHGREHLEINLWLKSLKAKNEKVKTAFQQRFFFLEQSETNASRGFGAAYNLDDITEVETHQQIIEDGLKIFKKIYGYDAFCFTPPATYYNSQLNKALYANGIQMIDIPKLRSEPKGNNKYNRRIHYTGQKTPYLQYHVVRNAVFEPNITNSSDGVEECLQDISQAFKHNQPAIISNHRAAFVGGINEENRTKGLKALDRLLGKIFSQYPEAEFINPRQLGQLIVEKNN